MKSKRSPGLCSTVTAAIAVLTMVSSSAGQIRFGGDAAALFPYGFEEFSDFAGRPGTAFVTLGDPDLGITIGEKLVGQDITYDGTYDVVGGTPNLPLTMDTAIAAEVGLHLMALFGTTVVDGLGAAMFPDYAAIGEGALTVLYDRDQRVIGFDVMGSTSGPLTALFYDRAGSLIGEVTLPHPLNTTYVYSSDAANIAAVTLNNHEFGGLAFDNFLFLPANVDRDAVCSVEGPYRFQQVGDFLAVRLGAEISNDPNGDLWDYLWITDCPGASFDDPTRLDATLFIETEEDCSVECAVTLVVDDGVETDVCTTTVTIEGEVGSGVTCPSDTTVEADGTGNVEELGAWVQTATSDDPNLSNDMFEFNYECGMTGSTTVTWWVDNAGSGDCGGEAECTATFTILDATGPTLEVDTTPIVVTSEDCGEEAYVELPVATAYDADGTELEVTNNAPGTFPTGETTTVIYAATDECGNTTTATVDVTVLYGAGVEVVVTERTVRVSGQPGSFSTPLPSVVVKAYDMDVSGCARVQDVYDQGIDPSGYAAVVAECEPAGSALTDDDGVALLGLTPGRYLVIAAIETGDTEAPTVHLGRPVGQVRCDQWKPSYLELLVDQAGVPIGDAPDPR